MDDFSRQLDKMAKRVQNFAGEHQTSFAELLTDSFMQKHTTFPNADSFFDAIGIKTTEEFDAFPDEKMNAFVSSHSHFTTFQQMLDEATSEYITRQLGF
ncbi:hypothetical protein [Limosilactobacillus sp.]|uniref:hypothetical protein n=1 Tax=Limosilactobacillus sp. TaxID=2773925 RepID=UPI003EFE2567